VTGAALYALLELDADVNYSGYIDPTSANTWFEKAFIESVQEIWGKRFNEQNSFDEISYLIATGQQYNVNPTTNSLYLGYTQIPLTMIWNVGNLVTVTSTLPHDIINGTRIQFKDIIQSSAGNMIQLNGQIYTVTVVDLYTFTFTSNFTITNVGAFTSGIITFPDTIPQYSHLLFGEAQFTKNTPYTVVASTNATPIMITLNTRSYLRDEDEIVIAGIGGNTNANGTFFLKYANEFNYFLYTDMQLQNPVSGNGVQTGVGTVSQITKSTLRFKRSDEKKGIYGKPTVDNPFYQQSYNLIKILPEWATCNWIKLDFIRDAPFQIDVTDTTTDLSNYYSESFQYLVENKALRIFFESTKDIIGIGTASNEVHDNP